MADTPYIEIIIGGNSLYFIDTHPFWRLEKNNIEFILPNKTDARDISRVVETITLRGTMYDSTLYIENGQPADGYTAMQRMAVILAAAKNKRKYQYLLWLTESFKVWFQTIHFDKAGGEGDAISYELAMVVVDK